MRTINLSKVASTLAIIADICAIAAEATYKADRAIEKGRVMGAIADGESDD